MTNLRNQSRHFAKIVLGFLIVAVFSVLVRAVKLKTQWDINHQEMVADYFLYSSALLFMSNTLSFWIQQTANNRIRGIHIICLVGLMVFMLYMTTYFLQQAWNMNDDLTQKEEDQPMDWRIRNILISYLLYYLVVI